MKKKLKILYGSDVLENCLNNDFSRSGIYTVAYNLLKEFDKSEKVSLTLFCKYSSGKIFKNAFKDMNIELLYDYPRRLIYRYYDIVKRKKNRVKNKKQIFKKLKYQFLIYILSPCNRFMNFFDAVMLDKKLNNYNWYFSPMNAVPKVIEEKKNIKKLTLLHDTIPIVFNFDRQMRFWYWDLFKSLNKEDFYVANSEYTKRDFIKYAPAIDSNKIFVSLLACNERFQPQNLADIEKVKQKYSINGKYVFSLGNIESRKNLLRVIRSFYVFLEKNQIDDLSLVVSGSNWDDYLDKVKSEINVNNKYKDKIILTGYVRDEDLPKLYSGAEWFVYTSAYEGFGLPPLEAMSSGCPVITSNNTSLPEVVGNAGIMIDYDSDEQHINAFETYYYNPQIREENKIKGLERAKLFSWKKCTEKIIDIMEKN